MASTLALSRPSEKLGTHSTRVDMVMRISVVGARLQPTSDKQKMLCRISKTLFGACGFDSCRFRLMIPTAAPTSGLDNHPAALPNHAGMFRNILLALAPRFTCPYPSKRPPVVSTVSHEASPEAIFPCFPAALLHAY